MKRKQVPFHYAEGEHDDRQRLPRPIDAPPSNRAKRCRCRPTAKLSRTSAAVFQRPMARRRDRRRGIGWTGQWALHCRTYRASVSLRFQRVNSGRISPTPARRVDPHAADPAGVVAQGQPSAWTQPPEAVADCSLCAAHRRQIGRCRRCRKTHGSSINAGNETTERNQLEMIAKMPAMGLEAYWLDAGWFEGGWPDGVGSWVPRKDHFPRGLRPLGNAAHKAGLKFILWFEPERVFRGSRIEKEHPQWLLKPKAGGDGKLGHVFNLGNPEAPQVDDGFDIELHLGLGRRRLSPGPQPLSVPILADGKRAGSQWGFTEIRHVEGLYAMWDDLLKAPSAAGDRQRELARDGAGPGSALCDRPVRGRAARRPTAVKTRCTTSNN